MQTDFYLPDGKEKPVEEKHTLTIYFAFESKVATAHEAVTASTVFMNGKLHLWIGAKALDKAY